MGNCSSGGGNGGPFSEGRDLVEFVYNAHGGGMRDQPLPGGGLATVCQECDADFTLETFVMACPKCQGVHAVAPPRADDAANIQYAGADFRLS